MVRPVIALLLMSLAALPAHAKPAGWSYDNDYTGQEEWGLISPAYAACGVGTRQSPIVIGKTEQVDAPHPVFDYRKSKVSLLNRGYTIEIAPQGTQTYTEGSVVYYLRAIHFHTPSEHVVGDAFYPLEIQLIHESDKGQKLIVAVFSNIGMELPAFNDALGNIPDKQGVTLEAELDPSVLLPTSLGHFAYTGSLTTPPCTEGIEWRVLKTPVSISRKQLAMLGKFTGRNARLAQPIYMRTVKEIN